jgi:uncharacterized protein (TIGR04222 family)
VAVAVAIEVLLDMPPFDWPEMDFLALYCAVIAGGLGLALLLRWAMRSPGGAPGELPALHPYEIAYLAGGPSRAVHAAVATLLQRGLLTLGASTAKLFPEGEPPADLHPLERQALAAPPGTKINTEVDVLIGPEYAPLASRLEGLGLALAPPAAARARWAPVVVLALVLLFGLVKLGVEFAAGQSVTMILIVCAVPAALGALAWYMAPFRSRRGDAVLARLRQEHAALEQQASGELESLTADGLIRAVGLFGPDVLSNGPLRRLPQAIRMADTSASESVVLPPPKDEGP